MIYNLNFAFTFLFFIILQGCFPDIDSYSTNRNLKLTISVDSLKFDTLISNINHITKRFEVYNHNAENVKIEEIYLGRYPQSPYRVHINGIPVEETLEETLLAGDHINVLVSVKFEPNGQDTPVKEKDLLVFVTNGNRQEVELLAWSQDTHTLQNSMIDRNTVFRANRSYLINESIVVDTDSELRIEKGVKLYFAFNKGMTIHGSLICEGSPDAQIMMINIRQDGKYKNAIGQWQGINFTPSSHNNMLKHVVLRNAVTGLKFDSLYTSGNNIQLQSVRIENISKNGIEAIQTNVMIENLLVNNCSRHAIYLSGGKSTITHATLAIYPNNINRLGEVIKIENLHERLTDFTLINSIVWGVSRFKEEIIVIDGKKASLINIQNSLIKSSLPRWDMNENLLSTEDTFPRFINPHAYEFKLAEASPAINTGVNQATMLDLDGTLRDNEPDMGAFEWLQPGR